jgi:hypothetical protein
VDGSSGRDNGLPSICGSEELVDEATRAARDHPAFVSAGAVGGRSFGYMRSAFGVALHMRQLLIPAGGNDLRTASLVSNPQHMLNKPRHARGVWVCRRTFAYVEQARAALGITPRSSSAVFVVVGGPPEDPRLLDRRRIDLVGGDLPMQVYHAAAALDVPAAGRLIERWVHAGVDSVAAALGLHLVPPLTRATALSRSASWPMCVTCLRWM